MFSTGLGPLSTSLQLLCGLELGGTFAPTLAASMLIEDVGLRDFKFAVDRTWDSGVNLPQGDPCDPSYCGREPRAWGYCTNSSTRLPLPAIHSDSSMYSCTPSTDPQAPVFSPTPGTNMVRVRGTERASQRAKAGCQEVVDSTARLWITQGRRPVVKSVLRLDTGEPADSSANVHESCSSYESSREWHVCA